MSEPTRDDELVASLRSRAENALGEGTATAQADAWYFTQSAVAIEHLKAQVEALTREKDEYRNELNRSSRWKSRAEIAEAEVASLSMHLDGARGVLKETEDRVVKLHRALQGAIDMLECVGHDDDTPEQAKIDWQNDLASLRKALEKSK